MNKTKQHITSNKNKELGYPYMIWGFLICSANWQDVLNPFLKQACATGVKLLPVRENSKGFTLIAHV